MRRGSANLKNTMMLNTKTGVILSAGIGERLDIFETNKPLIKLQGISLILRSIDRFMDSGINNIYIVIRKHDRLIRKELFEYEDHIHFIEQQHGDKGMLGSLLSIESADIKTPFFVTPCDLLFEKDPFLLFDDLSDPNAISVLISTNQEFNSLSGAQQKLQYIDGRINYPDKPEKTNALEVGIYHFTPKSYSNFSYSSLTNNKIKTGSKIFKTYDCLNPVVMEDNEWFDINTPVTLIRADLFLKKKFLPDKKLKPLEASFKPLSATATFSYSKQIHFDVHVGQGLVEGIKEYEIIPHEFYYSPHHILVDKNIDDLYGQKICDQLVSVGYQIHKHVIDPGERSKSISYFSTIAENIMFKGIDKKSIIITVGGGVIKDLAGFLASTLYRGIGFICFPTTVLSQCDAAIALKQGVNGTRGKNLIGSYYAPMKVIVDPSVLITLDERYICDGLAECLKQSFAQDVKFFNFLKNYKGNIKDINFLEKAIKQSIKLKVKSIQHDYFEENIALANQYGHKVGHAVEHLSGYQILHGESVAIGMRVSAELSYIMGLSEKEVLDAHIGLLKKYHLPLSIPRNIAPGDIINTLRYNKKFHGGKARMVLVSKIGSLWHDAMYYTVFCDDQLIEEAINKSYA